MGNANYNATVGLKLLSSEIGSWLTELTTGNASGAGVSDDISSTAIDLDATGTVVKSVVESGSEVVGWGSFSTSNFLSRAYGADLDVGSGEAVSIHAWIKTSTITGDQGIAGTFSAGASGDRGGYGLRLTGSSLSFAVSDSGGVIDAATDSVALSSDKWVFCTGTLSTTGDLKLYKNADLVAQATGVTIDATAELFQVGVETSAGVPANAFQGDIACLKVHGSELTQSQIYSVYESEKGLFVANSIFTRVGVSYDIALSLSSANRTESTQSARVIAAGGQQETIHHRRDAHYNLMINRLAAANLPALRTFLHSVEAGEIFELDRYGSAASPDNPVRVIADPGYTESRNGVNDYYTVNIKVREA